MALREIRILPHVVGASPARRLLPLGVVGLLLLASVGFALGLNVGLSLPWIVLAFGIATAAGVASAGLLPTVGSLWLVGCWWFAFPPLVGYITGNWEGAGRYSYPRMMGYGYQSARGELLGGIELGVRLGLQFAVVAGLVGYAVGVAIGRLSTRTSESR